MYEIFFFVNPIGSFCFDAEQEIEQVVDSWRLHVCYHMVPLASLETVKQDIFHRSLKHELRRDYGYYSHAAFATLNYYHAVRLSYGNKKARNFLCSVQRDLNRENYEYSSQLLKQIFNRLQVDEKQIERNLHDPCLEESINQDAALARKWKIENTPTTVIFNEDNCSNIGLLLEGRLSKKEIMKALFSECHAEAKATVTPHLRLL